MKYSQAKKLLSLDIETMDLAQLQKHRVKILDAWRESKAEYGIQEAIKNGFYVELNDFAGRGSVPNDYWLTRNLSTKLDAIEEKLQKMYS